MKVHEAVNIQSSQFIKENIIQYILLNSFVTNPAEIGSGFVVQNALFS